MRRYKSAVVLCDMEWVDPDLRVANGIAISDQGDMLRLDAMLMTVQLNLRKMLEVWSPTCKAKQAQTLHSCCGLSILAGHRLCTIMGAPQEADAEDGSSVCV